jgi:type II secretory pathway pseudopilin PulG
MSDRVAIVVERVGGILLLVGALGLPWLGFAVLRRLGQRSKVTRSGILGLGVVASVLISSIGILFAVCYYPGPPGVGAVPRAAQRRAQAVAHALASYRTSSGRYPSSLEVLVPASLADTVLPRFRDVVGSPLVYQSNSDGASFRLEFRYSGPGSNRCSRTDTSTRWECSGLF